MEKDEKEIEECTFSPNRKSKDGKRTNKSVRYINLASATHSGLDTENRLI